VAISFGVAPHRAWISCNGTWPIEHGAVHQVATRGQSSFNVNIPMNYPGAYHAFCDLTENSTEVWAQNVSGTGVLITGSVLKVTYNYLGGIINLWGQDVGYKLHEQKSSETFKNQKGSQITQTLAGRCGIPCQAEASKLMAGKKIKDDFVKLTDGISYATVIHLLAQYDGARFFVDRFGTLIYQIQDQTGGGYSVFWKMGPPYDVSDALDLQVIINVRAARGGQVKVPSWHPKKKKLITGNSSFGSSGGITYHQRIQHLEQEQADQWAQARAHEHDRHQREVRAECVGDVNIDVHQGLTLSGTTCFDDSYTIDQVDHDFGMTGYRMAITASTGGGGGGGGAPELW